MCDFQNTFVNPSKYLSRSHYKKYVLACNCGKCHCCRQRKRMEWSLRTQYEFKRTLDSGDGSFVLFDCLTYDDLNIPRFSDFYPNAALTDHDHYCFNRDHLRKFFLDLNYYIRKAGYDPTDSMSHYVGAEYGSVNKTMRPHYHLLLFVRFPIPPLLLSELVQKSWPYGHTDGYPWRYKRYTLEHNVISNKVGAMKVANYVSKYVNKPIEQTAILRSELVKVFDFFHRSWLDADTSYYDWMSDYDVRKDFDRIFRQVSAFHLQSSGFGDYALVLHPEVEHTLRLPLVGKDKVSDVSLPLYYFRKIFYDVVKNRDGSRRWIPNEKYRIFKLRSIASDVARLSLDLESRKINLMFSSPEKYNLFVTMMGDRSLKDLAIYQLFYRYRYRDCPACCVTPDLVVRLSYSLGSFYPSDFYRGFHTKNDYHRYKGCFFSLGDWIYEDQQVLSECYSQDSDMEFHHYDDVLDLLYNYDIIDKNIEEQVNKDNDIQFERYSYLQNAL